MELTGHNRYRFTIDYGYLNFRGEGEYGAPFSKRWPKLYVVSSGGMPIYVGAATKPIKDRLSDGIRPSSKRRYLWSWSSFALEDLAVDVWAVDLDCQDIETMTDDPNMQLAMDGTINKKPEDIILETLEAELVLLIHQNYHQWPKYQQEIHFHKTSDALREKAIEIFEQFRRL